MPLLMPVTPGVYQFKMYHREEFNCDYAFKITGALDARLAFCHAGKVMTNPPHQAKPGLIPELVRMPALIVTANFTPTQARDNWTTLRVWCQTEDREGPNSPDVNGHPPHPLHVWEPFTDVFFTDQALAPGELTSPMVRVWVPRPDF